MTIRLLLPSVETLCSLFDYSIVEGYLYNKGTYKRAGNLQPNGRIRVQIDGVKYQAHRIIWKMVTGNEPPEYVDHINLDPANNAFHNLRELSNSENCSNCNVSSITGYKNIYLTKRKSYKVQIRLHGVLNYLGTFKTLLEAKLALAAFES